MRSASTRRGARSSRRPFSWPLVATGSPACATPRPCRCSSASGSRRSSVDSGRGHRRRRRVGPRDRPAEHLPRDPPGHAPGYRPGRRARARPRRRQPDEWLRGSRSGRTRTSSMATPRSTRLLRLGGGQGRARPDDVPARGALPGLRLGAQPGLRRPRASRGHRRLSASRPIHRRSFLALQRTLAGDQLSSST